MLRWRKILVATDFSPSADAALRSAMSLARQVGGSLTVVHVVQLPVSAYNFVGGTLGPADLESAWIRESRKELQRVVRGVRKEYSRIRGFVRVGKPWSEILEAAREEGAEAVCLGNSGRSSINRFLTGSTAENVVRRAGIPVLVTRERPLGEIRRLLVPVDFDAGSKTALRFALDRFPARTEIEALYVFPPILPMEPAMGPLVPDIGAVERELRTFLEAQGAARARSEVRVLSDPSSEILQQAAGREVDLIVIATHGRRGLPRALLGSVAEKIIRRADRPVLVLPGPGRAASAAGPKQRTRSQRVRSRPPGARPLRERKGARPRPVPAGRSGRGPWTGQAHTGRGGPAGRRGGGSSAGKRHGGRRSPGRDRA